MKEQSQDGEKFIRAYFLDDDSPKVILFTDEELDDIANFCCNDVDGHKSILYVHVTFQLGPFLCWLLLIEIQRFTQRTLAIPFVQSFLALSCYACLRTKQHT